MIEEWAGGAGLPGLPPIAFQTSAAGGVMPETQTNQ